MYLTIDILEIAQPVVSETKKVSFVLRFLYFIKNRVVNNFNNHLTTLNLALEGVLNRMDDLSIEKSSKLLIDTKGIIFSIENMESDLASRNYLDREDIKENIKYTLKCLYKLESKLHKNVYKSAPTIKVDEDLKEGISRMNASNMNQLLSC